jgi:ATP-binding cassette, subfamily A (ABC1), member 3
VGQGFGAFYMDRYYGMRDTFDFICPNLAFTFFISIVILLASKTETMSSNEESVPIWKALDLKNFKVFSRNSDRVKSELMNYFLMFGIIILFGLSVAKSKVEYSEGAAPNFNAISPAYYNKASGMKSSKYYLGNTEVDDGCSNSLKDLIKIIPFCGGKIFGTNDDNNCQCLPPSIYNNNTWAYSDENNYPNPQLMAAISFDTNTDNNNDILTGGYTIYSMDQGLTDYDFNNGNVNSDVNIGSDSEDNNYENSQTLNKAITPLQIGIDTAFLEKDIILKHSYFPQKSYTYVDVSGVTFVPLYTILLLSIGLMTITTEICKETKEGLRHGLYMIGLDPYTYWLGWIRLMLLRLLITIIPLLLVVKGFILFNTSISLLLLVIIGYSLWTINFSIFCGLSGINPGSVNIVLVIIPTTLACVTYAYIPYLYQPTYIIPLSGDITILFSFLFSPFSAALMLVFGLLKLQYGASYDLSTINSMTPFLVKPSIILIMLYLNVLIFSLINFYFIRKSRLLSGHTSNSNSSNDQLLTSNVSTKSPIAANNDDKINSNTEFNDDIAVSVKNLKKDFIRADGTLKVAVDGLNVDFHKNEITSFLGHNGAGKSTTISLLTGLVTPTSGDAIINNKYSIVNDMGLIRPLIGVCPQTNVLWDLLTCKEHMQLFARIRGITDIQAEKDIQSLFTEMNFLDKCDTYAKDLSGGQKRKLQTACALIGDPEIIFLDEPTAGMDSSARRDMWDILIKRKKGKSIILCTHQMDEADILGDRVAVVSSGKLQAIGTPPYLKSKYGRGTTLDISLLKGTNRHELLEFISNNGGNGVEIDLSEFSENKIDREQIKKEILDSRASGDIRLILPNSNSSNVNVNINVNVTDNSNSNIDLSQVLSALEKKRDEPSSSKTSNNIKIDDFGVSATTLEDVFWELGKQAEIEHGIERDDSLPKKVDLTPPDSFHMLKILLWRQLILLKRNLFQQFRDNLTILIFLGVGIFWLNYEPNFNQSSPTNAINLNDVAFNNVNKPYSTPWNGNGQPVTTTANAVTNAMSIASGISGSNLPSMINATDVTPCLSAWLVDTTNNNVCPGGNLELPTITLSKNSNTNNYNSDVSYVGAYEFTGSNSSAYEYTIYQNQSISFTTPTMISFINNGVLDSLNPNNNINLSVSWYPWIQPVTDKDTFFITVIVNFILATIGGLLFSMGITYLGAKSAMNIVEERVTNTKSMQILMGVTKFDYYIAQLFWDLAQFFIILLIPIIVIFSLNSRLSDGSLILVLILYVLAICPIMYMCCNLFNESGPAYSSLSLVGLITFVALFIIYSTYSGITLGQEPSATQDLFYYFFLLHPIFNLSQALTAITWGRTFDYNPLLMVSPKNLKYGFVFRTAAWPCIYLFLEFIIFSVIYLYLEYGGKTPPLIKNCLDFFNQCCFRCVYCDCCWKDDNGGSYSALQGQDGDEPTLPAGQKFPIELLEKSQIEDDDVEEERQACINPRGDSDIEMTNRSSYIAPSKHAVYAQGIHQEYPPSGKQRFKGTTAVHDFTLRIRQKECMSLLGSNGAGKTTIMNILLKQLEATSGNVSINGEDIYNLSDKTLRSCSYCPQQNALFDNLTAMECLQFYALVRGCNNTMLNKFCDEWVKACDLVEHVNTRCCELSGGNKRKLSLAVSLIGNPSFIVLDEPSAGVDPPARRKLHWLINAVKRSGATIILTTHHMDEAASLGDRVGIMVKGYLCCLGTVQHLLSKYSQGYLLTCCMNEGYTVNDVLLPAIKKVCINVEVEKSSGKLFCIMKLGSSRSFSISELYKLLQMMQINGQIDYYTVGQSRLEDVFLYFTEKLLKSPTIGISDEHAAGAGAGTGTVVVQPM